MNVADVRTAPLTRSLLFACFAVACAPPDTAVEEPCALLPGDLAISEVFPDPDTTTNSSEYVEVFNARDTAVSLSGVTFAHAAANGTSEKRLVLRQGSIDAGAYFSLSSAAPPSAGDLSGSYGLELPSLRNDAGRVSLRCGSTLVDAVTYSGVARGHARELDGALTPDATVNDDGGRWCDARSPISDASDGKNFGTPGSPNMPCNPPDERTCIDALSGVARAVVSPEPGMLVIAEVMANPAAATESAGEWLEIYALSAFDMNGLVVRTSGANAVLASERCLHVEADSYALLARSTKAAENGGLPDVSAPLAVSLANSAGFVTVERDGDLIDGVSWATTSAGVSFQLEPEARSWGAEERAGAWCAATSTYGAGDFGTPGLPNTPCAVEPKDDECLDATSGAVRPIRAAAAGDLRITELMAHPTRVPDASGEWFELWSRRDLDLNGLELANENSSVTALSSRECLSVTAGNYLLFARSDDPSVNGGLPQVDARFDFALANSGAHTLTVRRGTSVIDRVTYHDAPAGSALALTPDALLGEASSDPSLWCPAATLYGAGDRGTPAAPNAPCDAAIDDPPQSAGGSASGTDDSEQGGAGGASGTVANGGDGGAVNQRESAGGSGGSDTDLVGPEQCIDPSTGAIRDITHPAPAELAITEIMAAPSVGNGGAGEWFEVFVRRTVDLNGLTFRNETGSALTWSNTVCEPVSEGARLLFARSEDSEENGGLPFVTARFDFGLADSASSTYNERSLSLELDERVLDRVTWTSSTRGASRQLALDVPDTAGAPPWCLTPTDVTFGSGDRGTPGTENVACP